MRHADVDVNIVLKQSIFVKYVVMHLVPAFIAVFLRQAASFTSMYIWND